LKLVPPGAQVTDVGEILGSEIIAGPHHASVRFTDQTSSPEDLSARARAHAVAEGWEIVKTDAGPGAWQVQLKSCE
jgi:type II secretory pathway component PulM